MLINGREIELQYVVLLMSGRITSQQVSHRIPDVCM